MSFNGMNVSLAENSVFSPRTKMSIMIFMWWLHSPEEHKLNFDECLIQVPCLSSSICPVIQHKMTLVKKSQETMTDKNESKNVLLIPARNKQFTLIISINTTVDNNFK